MRNYQQVDPSFVGGALKDSITKLVSGAPALDVAAQKCVQYFCSEFPTSALVRLYATCTLGSLPPPNREFVDQLAQGAGVAKELNDATIVLSLMGTSGAKPEWNDRRKSRGHVGIPLISSKFVSSIPMIARLLVEFGVGTDWIGRSGATDMISKSLGRMGAVFHVPDAASYRDDMNRLVIPAQDFVSSQGIKSVIGIGGAYLDGSIAAILCFTKETVSRAVAERFLPFINYFKTGTMGLVRSGRLFS